MGIIYDDDFICIVNKIYPHLSTVLNASLLHAQGSNASRVTQ